MALEQIKRIDESLSSILESSMKPSIIENIFHDSFWIAMIRIFQIINETHEINYTEITDIMQQARNTALKEKHWTWKVENVEHSATVYVKLNKIINVLSTGTKVPSAECFMSKSQDFPDGSTERMKNFELVIRSFETLETILPKSRINILNEFNNNPIWKSTATRAQAPLSEQPIPTPKISD